MGPFRHLKRAACCLLMTSIALAAVMSGWWPGTHALAQTSEPTATAAEASSGKNQPSSGPAAPSTEKPAEKPAVEEALPLFPKELLESVRKLRAQIGLLTKSIERVREEDDQLATFRPEIVSVANEAESVANEIGPHIETVDRLISGLGDKPKKGEPAETASVVAERQRLELAKRQLLGARQQAKLTQVRAKQLISRIQSLRLENLSRNLRKRHPGLLSFSHWQTFGKELPRFGTQVATVADNWWAIGRNGLHWLILIMLGAGALCWTIYRTGKANVREMMREPLETGVPAYLSRISMAIKTLPYILAPGLITACFVYLALALCGLLNDQVNVLALAGLKAGTLLILTSALAKTILLPWEPSWRLIGLPTRVVRRYLWLIRCLAGVYFLDMWLNEAFAALQVPVSIGITTGFVTNLAFAALLFAFVWLPTYGSSEETARDEPVEQRDNQPADPNRERISARLMRKAIYWLRLPATIAVAAIIGATLLGYLALGRFIAGQVMLIGIGAAALLLGHLAARALAARPETLSPRLDNALETGLALSAKRRRQTFGLLSVLLNAALAIGAVAVLLLSWGYSDAELVGWAKSLIFGFEIGKFKFSLLQILIALALFVAVILLTRLFQSWLSKRVLSTERVDRGIANSVHAGIGYAGVALAGLVGVSYAGLDLSNVALIASALSIGIGFGLNAIASNFVSGLIMLIERPIKVGDWVVVGSHQGYVRHISVRATEIETFDRASVIIPNSDFMTSAVQNWTHRNAMGRVVVDIGASYNADPNEVMEVLRQVANECDALLKYPAPSVQFEAFGASSLDFSIRGFIADVNSMMSAKTALRLGIAKAFAERNLEIPFPQQDLHLRDLDGVRAMVGKAMAERAANAAAETITPQANDNDRDKT